MEKIMEFTMKLTPEDLRERADTKAFADRFIPYVEVDLTDQVDKIATAVLSGTLALLVEGYPQAILIDARTYPSAASPSRMTTGCCGVPGTALWKRWFSTRL